jgi:hypothetical protein
MVIGDTIQLDSFTPPGKVKIIADVPEEVTIATLNPPRVEEEPEPELEEEAGLVGEEAEAEAPAEEAEGDEAAEGGDGDEG